MHRRSFLRRLFAAVPAAVVAPAVAAEVMKQATPPATAPAPAYVGNQTFYTGVSSDHTHTFCVNTPSHTHTFSGWTNYASTSVTR